MRIEDVSFHSPIFRAVPIALLLFAFVGSGDSGLGIMSTMNIHFLVTDPLGRRTGFDPDTKEDLNEIPTSHYDVQSIGAWEGNQPEISTREFSTAFGTEDTLIDGEYNIRIVGQASGPYSLDIEVYRNSRDDTFNLKGLIEKGQTKFYVLYYVSDSSKVIVIDSLATK
jgi:hypothetical protein